MPYEAFHNLFPQVGASETRSAAVMGRVDLPDAEYGFVEFYCTEPKCDCRRALIKVISPQMPGQELATLSYGWDTAAFYGRTLHDSKSAEGAAGVSLERLAQQSDLAAGVKRLFEEIVADANYAERIKRHYAMVKNRLVSSAQRKPKMRYRRR